MAIARSQPIAITNMTKSCMKDAAIFRDENKLMLTNMYAMCGHSRDNVKKVKTLSEAGIVYEAQLMQRETIGPATVRSEAPPDWRSETRFVWYRGEQCSITIEMKN